MKRKLARQGIRDLERKFWISTAAVTFVVLVLTLLDGYFLGFR